LLHTSPVAASPDFALWPSAFRSITSGGDEVKRRSGDFKEPLSISAAQGRPAIAFQGGYVYVNVRL
jgi:hypothetical protein